MAYQTLKKLVIDVVDDFSDLDVNGGYFPAPGTNAKYNAKTKLDTVKVTTPVRSVMPPKINKELSKRYRSTWRDVSAFETVKLKTIGDAIKLCAEHAGETIPTGEPT
jgi:hypothetical protein